MDNAPLNDKLLLTRAVVTQMSTLSRNETNKKSKIRSKEVTKWVSEHRCKQNKKHPAFINGSQSDMDVYELPRYLLRLNPDNWRFKAEFDAMKAKRQRSGKPLELDPDNEEDKKIIRELIMGINPKNEQRKERYQELKKDFIANSKNGGNGQITPGIILHDGTYINGNRRDTILEDLSKNPPQGCQPTSFQHILVARLPEDVTLTDIKAIETREQISLDSRERYDYTNGALMVSDYMEHLTKVEKLDEKAAIKQIANQVFGLTENNIQEYLSFKKTADDFLQAIGRSGQYSYIQETSKEKDEGGIVQILKEIGDQKQKIRKMTISRTKIRNLVKTLYAFAWYSKEKPRVRDRSTGKLKPMNYNHKAFRNFKRDAFDSVASVNKLLESGTIEKIDWKNPQDHALAFSSDVIRAQNVTSIKNSIWEPLVWLEDVAGKTSQINQDLNGPNSPKIKEQILEKGVAYVKQIQSNISEIAKKTGINTKKI